MGDTVIGVCKAVMLTLDDTFNKIHVYVPFVLGAHFSAMDAVVLIFY